MFWMVVFTFSCVAFCASRVDWVVCNFAASGVTPASPGANPAFAVRAVTAGSILLVAAASASAGTDDAAAGVDRDDAHGFTLCSQLGLLATSPVSLKRKKTLPSRSPAQQQRINRVTGEEIHL
jgi:hypothetical protein